MTDNTWPNEPQRRKIILVLDPQDIGALRFEDGGPELLLDKQLHIIPSDLDDSNPNVQVLIDRGLVHPGAVLIQSPFNKSLYENSEQAVERFSLEKHIHFSTLCGHLGAREVSVEQIEHKNIEGEKIYTIDGGHPLGVGGEIRIEDQEVVSLCRQMTMKNTFEGREPNVQAARELIEQVGLKGDVQMNALIDMRGAGLTSQKLQLNMTSEVKRNLNVLARLKIPAYLSLEAGYDRHVREKTEFTLTIKVDF